MTLFSSANCTTPKFLELSTSPFDTGRKRRFQWLFERFEWPGVSNALPSMRPLLLIATKSKPHKSNQLSFATGQVKMIQTVLEMNQLMVSNKNRANAHILVLISHFLIKLTPSMSLLSCSRSFSRDVRILSTL